MKFGIVTFIVNVTIHLQKKITGEVIVHRLHWQKLWIHPPPTESDRVRGIDWRPDEKIIAIGYSSGLVLLLDIENEHEIHAFKLGADITCLGWTQNSTEITDETLQDNLFVGRLLFEF